VIGNLVEFNPKCFEDDTKEFGCGLVLTEPVRRQRLRFPLPRLPRPRPRPPRPGLTNNWVEVLWNGKIYWEYTDFLVEI